MVLDLEPDVLMVTWAGGGALKLFQQINQMKLPEQMAITTSIGDRATLRGACESAVGFKGWSATSTPCPTLDIFTAGGMAAGIAIVEGIKKAGATDAEKLIPVLEEMSFDGPNETAPPVKVNR